MSDIAALDFMVDRADLSSCKIRKRPLSTEALLHGQVLLRIERFSFTANNVTYAALGDAMQYWQFFPAPEGKGVIPVWGFAEVLVSRCDGVEPGERFYGYYPMSTHLIVEPTRLTAAGFTDGAEHRQKLPGVYNQYLRCSQDPLYSVENEPLQMLLRPLFTTSFLLDDFLVDRECFGASHIVLTSASSKTAIGLAYLLSSGRNQNGMHYKIVGLTSPGNREFAAGLGCYDQVLEYDELSQLDPEVPTVSVDFAGNGRLLGRLHTHFDTKLRYSCLVGASHWDQRGGGRTALSGPVPAFFFAPSQAEKRLKEWGGAEFQRRLSERWDAFCAFADQWLSVRFSAGDGAVKSTYSEILAGTVNPQIGHVMSLTKT